MLDERQIYSIACARIIRFTLLQDHFAVLPGSPFRRGSSSNGGADVNKYRGGLIQ